MRIELGACFTGCTPAAALSRHAISPPAHLHAHAFSHHNTRTHTHTHKRTNSFYQDYYPGVGSLTAAELEAGYDAVPDPGTHWGGFLGPCYTRKQAVS